MIGEEDARVSAEQETAMFDQPDVDESTDTDSIWERIRALGREQGFEFGTITVNGNDIDLRNDAGRKEQGVSEFGALTLAILSNAASTYKERNAVYQDNFRVVGKVMEALFPGGAPSLHDHHDYNRWHIFELVIVKLTRYVANWGNPDPDSLVDMLPYLAILGAQDEEMRTREQRRIDDEAEEERLAQRLRRAARGAGLYTSEPGPHSEELRRVRESRRKAREDATAPNYEADAPADEPMNDGDGWG